MKRNAFNQYALVKGNYEGKPSMRNQSPISGSNLLNIAITGKGMIDGNGDFWRMITKDRLTEREWKKKVASGGLLSEDGRTWYPSEKTRKAHKMVDPGAILPGKTEQDYQDVKDYLRPTLLNFTRWPITPLEDAEKIECLRYLENGVPLRMVVTEYMGVEIDTPEDLQKAEALLS